MRCGWSRVLCRGCFGWLTDPMAATGAASRTERTRGAFSDIATARRVRDAAQLARLLAEEVRVRWPASSPMANWSANRRRCDRYFLERFCGGD